MYTLRRFLSEMSLDKLWVTSVTSVYQANRARESPKGGAISMAAIQNKFIHSRNNILLGRASVSHGVGVSSGRTI